MIIAVGTDIVEVSRITKAMESPRFVQRVLTHQEREFIRDPWRVAGRWAAKEAIAKCLSVLGYQLSWQDVEILNNEQGVPYARIHKEGFSSEKFKLHVSISHEKKMAMAFAVLEALPSF
jgi:holo-[acyl-carrier protein] synthase